MSIAQRNAIRSAIESAIKATRTRRTKNIRYTKTYGRKAQRPLKGHRI